MQENNNIASKTDALFYLVHFIVMLLHCEKAINLVNEGIGQDFKDKKNVVEYRKSDVAQSSINMHVIN